jgi:alkylation response protein AidB-like acyl-CoA dehydrogenase
MMQSTTEVGAQDIRERAAEAARQIAPLADEYDRSGEFPLKSYEVLRALGLTTMAVPKEYGGLGLDVPTYCEVVSVLAGACGSTALTLNMHSSVLRQIEALGDEDQRRHYLGEAAAGRLFASLTSEPATSLRRNFRVGTTVKRVEGGYLLNGFKYFASLSGAADYFFVWAMPEGREDLAQDLLHLVVPARSPGVSIEYTWDSVAMRATSSHSVRFENVFVAEEAAVGGPGGAVRAQLTDVYMPGYAAVYTGLAVAARDAAVAYALERRFGPVRVADDAVVQNHVGRMDALVAAATTLTREAALAMASPPGPERALALNRAKYFASWAAVEVADLAMQVVGGRAFNRGQSLQRIFRDAHVGMVMPPSLDHALETVGKLALGFDVAGGFLG